MKRAVAAWVMLVTMAFAAAAPAGVETPLDPPRMPGQTTIVDDEKINTAPAPRAIALGVLGGVLVLLARRSMRRA